MDKIGLESFSTKTTSSSILLLALLTFFLLILYYMKQKFSSYLRKRNKLKDLAEKYEKKREFRSGLAVKLIL